MTRWFILTAFLVAFIFVSFQILGLYQQYAKTRVGTAVLKDKLAVLELENKVLASDVEYYSDPMNAAKEFKSHFNYKRPGEKLIIVPNE